MFPVPEFGMLIFEGKQHSYGDTLDATCATPMITEASLADIEGLAVMFLSLTFSCGTPS